MYLVGQGYMFREAWSAEVALEAEDLKVVSFAEVMAR